jgi:hypothetical protein
MPDRRKMMMIEENAVHLTSSLFFTLAQQEFVLNSIAFAP